MVRVVVDLGARDAEVDRSNLTIAFDDVCNCRQLCALVCVCV